MADASSGMLRDELNARVSACIDRAWPSLLRVLSRMARARWELGVGATHRQRWHISTTARLLEPPQPIPLDLALGGVGACVHVEVQCAMSGAVEGWTVSFRAFPDRDEVQITGASVQISRDLSNKSLLSMLRGAERAGPAHYDLRLYPAAPPAEPSTGFGRRGPSDARRASGGHLAGPPPG